MSRTAFLRASSALGLVGLVWLQAPIGFAQSTEIAAEKLEALTKAYAELRRENPELEERSPQQIAADVQEIVRGLRERMPDTSTVTARSAEGSVSAAARCKEGYVVEGSHSADDQSVSIVTRDLRACDTGGCRAYEVSAASEHIEPFELTVSVDCSE